MFSGLTDLYDWLIGLSVTFVLLGGLAIFYGQVILGGVLVALGGIPLLYIAAWSMTSGAKVDGQWKQYVTYLSAIPQKPPSEVKALAPRGALSLGANQLRAGDNVAVPQCPGQIFSSADSPITIAAASGRAPILAWMLSPFPPPLTFEGAGPTESQRPPLVAATVCGHLADLVPLLEKSTHRQQVLDGKGLTRFTALHYASFLGDVAAVQTLLKLGLPADETADTYVVSPGYSRDLRSSDDGVFHTGKIKGCCHMTPLMNAAQKGSLPIVKLLHEHCADIGRRDPEHKKAWDYATGAGHADVAAYLKKARRPRNCGGSGKSS